jgi:ornithine cyclodeaminase/alanine dehydrogenase-like protein (mu-crystallin family)
VRRPCGGRPLMRAPGATHLGARGMPSNSCVGCGKQAEAQAARVAAQPSDIEDARACGRRRGRLPDPGNADASARWRHG